MIADRLWGMRVAKLIRATLFAAYVTFFALAAEVLGTRVALGCDLKLVGALPVDPGLHMAFVDVSINGHPTKLLVDTGSTLTSLWRDQAQSLNVKLGNTLGVDLYGVGGRSAVQLAYIDQLTIGSATVHNMRVYVIGSPSFGGKAAGLLGSDFLSQADVDFDLSDNKINLIRDRNCTGPQMVYWNKPYSQAKMQGGDAERTSFFVTVILNGQPVQAEIDSGATTTIIDESLAQRLGAAPLAAQTVTNEGRGIGYKTLPMGVVRFDSFTLGDETIKNAKIRAAPLFDAIRIDETGTRLGSHETVNDLPRMLLGIDFLRAHRLLISPSHQMIYFSYLGGPVFDIVSSSNRSHPPKSEPPVSTGPH